MIAQLDVEDSGNNFGGATGLTGVLSDSIAMDGDDMQTEEWVKRQKAEIKQLQGKLDASKKEFKQSQAEVEALRLEDPTLYRKKQALLDKVKFQLEKKIEKMNQRISKVKEIENKLRN